MSKIGVGVGEEFPVDENPRNDNASGSEDECRGHGRGRGKWHRFHHMHQQWHARRDAMRGRFHRRFGADAMHGFNERHMHHLIIGGLAMIGLAALLGALRHRD